VENISGDINLKFMEVFIMSKKMLVAYFSASGVTAKAAWKLSEAAGADLYEIKPEVPYSRADLDWTNKKSRSSVEMNDPASRPAIEGKMEDMEQYDVIFVGFPIWWYVAPTIINTFLESYDFSGKTIVPFATSGGSGLGKTNERLAPSCPGATLLKGKMLNGSLSQEELKAWAQSL
jgi:flavodoxin